MRNIDQCELAKAYLSLAQLCPSLLLNIFNEMKYILVTTKNTEIHEEEPCLIGVEFSPA